MSDSEEREEQILSAAVTVIVRLGYDKTTMSDIAEEAGVSRGTVYLYFKGKEELFEALVYREYMRYAKTWMEYIESDPRGGTVGGYYRATFRAVDSHPFIASVMRRDARVIGNYLRKPDNLFIWMQSDSIVVDFIRALQAAGAIRQDLDPSVITYIIEMLSYGQLMIGDLKPPGEVPPYDAVMEALADMMDRALLPEDGGNDEAGKAVVRQIVVAAKTKVEQMKRAKDKKQIIAREGAKNGNR